MKEEAKEYISNPSVESFYLIVNDLPTIERIKQKLLKILPKSLQKEKLSELAKYETEIYQILQHTPLGKPFAESVGINLHHHLREKQAETSSKF